MSRVAKHPIPIPSGVEVTIDVGTVTVKGPKGEQNLNLHPDIVLQKNEKFLQIEHNGDGTSAIAGTMRALVNNLVAYHQLLSIMT